MGQSCGMHMKSPKSICSRSGNKHRKIIIKTKEKGDGVWGDNRVEVEAYVFVVAGTALLGKFK